VETTVNISADLSITKVDVPDPVVAGESLTYTITVTNSGPLDAFDVVLVDDTPVELQNTKYSTDGGLNWISLWPGSLSLGTILRDVSKEIRVSGTVDPSVEVHSVITNTGSVNSSTNDANPSNNNVSQGTKVGARADLSITKLDSPDPVKAGEDLTYTVNVTNNGPSTAVNVVVTDTLPAGTTFVSASGTGWTCDHAAGVVTCKRDSLDPGAAPPITIVVKAPAEGGNITNNVAVSSSTPEPDPDLNLNNATAVTVVKSKADLSVTKLAPDPVTAGENLTYTVTVTNNGPSTAVNVVVTDTLPAPL